MKNLLKELIITIAQVLTFIYSFGIFFFAALTTTGTGLGGAYTYTQKAKEDTVVSAVIGLFYFTFPIWLLVSRLRKNVSRWEEILILLMGASPVILLLLISYFNL